MKLLFLALLLLGRTQNSMSDFIVPNRVMYEEVNPIQPQTEEQQLIQSGEKNTEKGAFTQPDKPASKVRQSSETNQKGLSPGETAGIASSSFVIGVLLGVFCRKHYAAIRRRFCCCCPEHNCPYYLSINSPERHPLIPKNKSK